MTTKYKIDPAHSSAQFVVRHMMISNVRGAFSNVQGEIQWDAADPAQSSIEATIDATTVNTNEAGTKVEPTGEGEVSVTGNLTIHGVTKEVVLKVEGPTAAGKDPWGNTRVGASATTKIKRSEFGLTWNAAIETGGILVGDDLKIELEVSLIQS
jgi:polyisoprenoid-binding protein YceI